jgi:methylglyoxal synthase
MNEPMNESFVCLPQALEWQETIVLLATPGMRQGPQSPLARLVSEFEPYWIRQEPPPRIFAAEGSYRALLRCGLLRSHPLFFPLPPGFRGALVYASDLVIASALKDPDDLNETDSRPLRVFYLIDPSDPTSMYPETVALKRDTVVAGKTFLATEAGIKEWLTLDLYAHYALQPHCTNLNRPERFWLEPQEIQQVLKAMDQRAIPQYSIALVAHDKKKHLLLEFAAAHFTFLRDHFRARYATGTTGDLLNGLPARRSVLDPREDPRIEGERQERIKAAQERLRSKLKGDQWVRSQPSGPRGGDTRIARRILDRECTTVMFFEDPHYAREHEANIQLLERASRIPDLGVLGIYDRRSAEAWASNWEACLSNGITAPMTLVEAFRRVFPSKVELVLAPSWTVEQLRKSGTADPEFRAILDTAAFYVLSLIGTLCRRRTGDDPVRIGVPWGLGIYELADCFSALRDIFGVLDGAAQTSLEIFHGETREQLEHRGAWPPRLTAPLADEDLLCPRAVSCVPISGVMGAYDARVEANSNAARLASILGGKAEIFGHYAFYRSQGSPPIPEWLASLWENLDLLIFTGDEVKSHLGSKVQADIPAELWAAVRGSVGECGGLYLAPDGRVWETGNFVRQGISPEAIRAVASRGGSILLIGGQKRRVPVALAMLLGGFVSTLITDLQFAWWILERHIPALNPAPF